MTKNGKFISDARRASSHLLALGFILASSLLIEGCKSSPAATIASRSPEQREELRAAVNAGKIFDCKLTSQEWFIPGDIQQAQIVKSKKSSALIYQALLRSGPRTVFQALTPGLAFQGDGYAVGLKTSPNVSDFRTFDDAAGNLGTVSRIKNSESELFEGLVELNVKDKTWRSVLQTPRNETVQQIWPVLPAGNGVASVVVRTTPIDESSESGPQDESTFYWFQVGLAENSARNLGTFRSTQINIQPAGFVSLEGTGEPVAVASIQPRDSDSSFEAPSTNTSSRISLYRMFHKSPQEKFIFSGKGNLSALSVSPPNNTGIHLSWIFSPRKGSVRYIQTTNFTVRTVPERFFSTAPLRELEPILATEIEYEGNDPEVLFTNIKNQIVPVLTWWGKIENDIVLVLQHIFSNIRAGKSSSIKLSDGTNIGISFSPALAFIPPRAFNRVMSVSAAQNASEKYIMVLSDRSESAELQKESLLYPCLF